MSVTEETKKRFANYITPNYARTDIAFVRGEGSWIWDEQGNKYLDFGTGIAVCSLGHSHPGLTKAIADQAATLLHCSNLYHIPIQGELGEYLSESVVGIQGKSFFCNSGAEANEGAIKFARLYGHQTKEKHGRVRGKVLTFTNSFHGRLFGTLSATAQTKIHHGFEPLLTGFEYLPFNDLDALKAAVDDDTVAILLEPLQGEGGINLATEEFLSGIAAIAKERDLLLMLDEVQCGIGRTGTRCGYQAIAPNIEPDVITFAKGIGGGFPIGAVWINSHEELADRLGPGTHGTTFGGTPLACAAALTVLREVERENLVENARIMEEKIRNVVEKWDSPYIKTLRGKGLMLGFALNIEAFEANEEFRASGIPMPSVFLARKLMDAGLINVPAGPSVVRWLPALNVKSEEVDRALEIFSNTLAQLS